MGIVMANDNVTRSDFATNTDDVPRSLRGREKFDISE